MHLLDRISSQMQVTRLPLVGITVAAVPCPGTPVIMTLHWHGFVKTRLVEDPGAATVAWTPLPSSALQVNEHWEDLSAIDLATLEAGWELGAWDVSRVEAGACLRPGADASEALDCLRVFGIDPVGSDGPGSVVAEAPDADDLVSLAGRRGYVAWTFRPVHGGLWHPVADDATLGPDGTRRPPCPLHPEPARGGRRRRTVYRMGVPRSTLARDQARVQAGGEIFSRTSSIS